MLLLIFYLFLIHSLNESKIDSLNELKLSIKSNHYTFIKVPSRKTDNICIKSVYGGSIPTILWAANLRFYFYSREGMRADIHVGLQSGSKIPELKIWLDTMEIAKLNGFSRKAEKQILTFVRQNKDLFLNEWEAYFND